MTTPEPACGETADTAVGTVTCDLPAGHPGVHAGGDRSYWRPLVPAERVPVDYEDLYHKSLRTAESAFGPKDPDELADRFLTRTELSRDDLAHILTRALLELVEPARVANLDELRAELVEAMNDVAHDNCGEDEPCDGEDYGQYVDDVLMPVLEKHAVKAEVRT